MTPHHQDAGVTVYIGDARDVLRALPERSVHCVVTSPPYFGLRDYGTGTWDGGDPGCEHRHQMGGEGASSAKQNTSHGTQSIAYRDRCARCGATRQDAQLGLEATPEEYVSHLVDVMREVRRVLRDDGTLWLVLGDSYAVKPHAMSQSIGSSDGRMGRGPRPAPRPRMGGVKPKDLLGIPWMVAFALRADGWYLRSDIIWAKPNPMPESVTDRPTKAHEYLFLLAKSERYHFDADAVREEALSPERARERPNGESVVDSKVRGYGSHAGTSASGRNIRSVWTIATQPYPGAHFATFPPKLVEPCIKAGTSERGVCADCGAPWRRVVERVGSVSMAVGESETKRGQGLATAFSGYEDGSSAPTFTTTGWRPTCDHDAPAVPATVLDPFAGTGTTALVAQQLGRRAVLIDLNAEYIDQALARASRSWGVGRRPRRRAGKVPADAWHADLEAAG